MDSNHNDHVLGCAHKLTLSLLWFLQWLTFLLGLFCSVFTLISYLLCRYFSCILTLFNLLNHRMVLYIYILTFLPDKDKVDIYIFVFAYFLFGFPRLLLAPPIIFLDLTDHFLFRSSSQGLDVVSFLYRLSYG